MFRGRTKDRHNDPEITRQRFCNRSAWDPLMESLAAAQGRSFASCLAKLRNTWSYNARQLGSLQGNIATPPQWTAHIRPFIRMPRTCEVPRSAGMTSESNEYTSYFLGLSSKWAVLKFASMVGKLLAAFSASPNSRPSYRYPCWETLRLLSPLQCYNDEIWPGWDPPRWFKDHGLHKTT